MIFDKFKLIYSRWLDHEYKFVTASYLEDGEKSNRKRVEICGRSPLRVVKSAYFLVLKFNLICALLFYISLNNVISTTSEQLLQTTEKLSDLIDGSHFIFNLRNL